MDFLYFIGGGILWHLCTICQQCPFIYQRYSDAHSYCKPPSESCSIFHNGFYSGHINDILKLHNEYRSMVATGKAERAKGLPEAADMLEMVWDQELAAIAQKRAQQCAYDRDCPNCRRVENFPVGQNIAYREIKCTKPTECPLDLTDGWAYVIKTFYDEIRKFDKNNVNMFTYEGKFGNFSQMVWSKTWKIGCGFVAFETENGRRELYVCNYGPSGNVLNTPMYKSGSPCSACPVNSCCGESCSEYEGLCRMKNINEEPIYHPDEDYIFYCDFRPKTKDCSYSVEGRNKWKTIKTLEGPFTEIVLNGGESSSLNLTNAIKPTQNFCVIVKYRYGPALDGHASNSTAVVKFETSKGAPMEINLPATPDKHQFTQFSTDIKWSYDTNVSFNFTVPSDTLAQYLNIQLVAATDGKCR